MTCCFCEKLFNIPISTPDDLKTAIKVLKDAINSRYLIEVAEREDASFSQVGYSFWEDYMLHYFICLKCRQPFRLTAETYHGHGGSLEAIETLQGHHFS